jgi:hypothetical protein
MDALLAAMGVGGGEPPANVEMMYCCPWPGTLKIKSNGKKLNRIGYPETNLQAAVSYTTGSQLPYIEVFGENTKKHWTFAGISAR